MVRILYDLLSDQYEKKLIRERCDRVMHRFVGVEHSLQTVQLWHAREEVSVEPQPS